MWMVSISKVVMGVLTGGVGVQFLLQKPGGQRVGTTACMFTVGDVRYRKVTVVMLAQGMSWRQDRW